MISSSDIDTDYRPAELSINPDLSRPALAYYKVIATLLASGYLRLLTRHGPKWREGLELAENQKDKKSAKTGSNRLDYSVERSMRCTGGKMITITLTRS